MAFSNWDSAKTNVMQYDPRIYPLQLGSKMAIWCSSASK